MLWFVAAFVFWIALRGELGTYAGFVTTSNSSGTLAAIFGAAKAGTNTAATLPGQQPPVAGGAGAAGGAVGGWLGDWLGRYLFPGTVQAIPQPGGLAPTTIPAPALTAPSVPNPLQGFPGGAQ